jgi:dTDP-glucose 4,6-dehydratase
MINMLEYARIVKPELFLQFSTDEVVGPVVPGQLHSEWAPIVPSNPYAASKAAQEAIAISYWRTYKVPVVISRCMNVIGAGQNAEKFLPMAVGKLAKGEAVGVHAKQNEDGTWESGSRCWTPVDWVSEAVIALISRTPYAHVSGAVDVPDMFNIVGEPLSNVELVKKLAKIMNVEPKVEYLDYHSTRPGHDLHYGLDGSKLRQMGIVSSVDFDEFLTEIVRSYHASN